MTTQEEKLATELMVTLDRGLDTIGVAVSNHASETCARLDLLSTMNNEMMDKRLQSCEVHVV